MAFLLSEGAVMIDFAGPWEVFQDVATMENPRKAFRLYTVAETLAPVRVSGGMTIVPDYSVQNAPAPKILVIPAQSGRSLSILNWIRTASKTTDVTMSVCTGAFLLAATGLLDGLQATTHHGEYETFAAKYPKVHVQRGIRYVENGNIASSGGLSSGIDLALHIVERYYGREEARMVAFNMEYQGQGWLNPGENAIYAEKRTSTEAHPLCPVCNMDASPSLKADFHGRTYYFCQDSHKELFLASPEKFAS